MSRQLDSLLKGLSIFQDGMQTAMQNKAIGDATSQAEAIRKNTEIDAEEQIAQLDVLASDLRLKLMQRGASAAAAESAGAAFGATPYQRATLNISQANAEKQTSVDPFKVTDLKFKQQKFSRDLAGDFESQTSDIRKKIDSGIGAQSALKIAATNPAAAGSLKTLFAKQLQPGNLTDREQAVFEGSPQILNQVQRLYTKYGKGEPLTPEDIKVMEEYNKTLLEGNLNEFNRVKEAYAGSQKEALLEVGLDPDKFKESLDQRFKYPSMQQQQALRYAQEIKELEAFARDPKFKGSREQILEQIEKLKRKQ